MIPDLYFDYLRTGDATPLRSVFYHNEMDVVSMAALLNYMTNLIADPIEKPIKHGLDLISIGKLYQDLGHPEIAAQTYQRGLTYDDLRREAYLDAIHKLSFLYKRRGEYKDAIKLWNEAAEAGEIYAHIELAKFYEHKQKKYSKAIEWTSGAITIVQASGYPAYERARYLPELEHRLARLERKLEKSTG
jgi:tetratricopeptide (TPR) repeat protein